MDWKACYWDLLEFFHISRDLVSETVLKICWKLFLVNLRTKRIAELGSTIRLAGGFDRIEKSYRAESSNAKACTILLLLLETWKVAWSRLAKFIEAWFL